MSAGYVPVALRYETTILLQSVTVGDDGRLGFVFLIEGQRVTAAWGDPAPEQVALIDEATSMGKLFWSGVAGDDRGNPQLIRLELDNAEAFHKSLKQDRGGERQRRGLLVV